MHITISQATGTVVPNPTKPETKDNTQPVGKIIDATKKVAIPVEPAAKLGDSNKPYISKPHRTEAPAITTPSVNLIKKIIKLDGHQFFTEQQAKDAYYRKYGNADPKEIMKQVLEEQEPLRKAFVRKEAKNVGHTGSQLMNEHVTLYEHTSPAFAPNDRRSKVN
jgi:hypothetical protein